MLRIWIVLSLLCSASPASAFEVKSKDFSATDAPNKAFVLLSTSAAATSISFSTVLRVQRVTRKGAEEKLKGIDGFYVDNPFFKSHSATEQMNVHWRALEAGDYMLDVTVTNTMTCTIDLVEFRFTVAAGQALYLGDFRLENQEVFVRDQYDRDFEFFTAHANGMKPAAFTLSLPERTVRKNPKCPGY